MSSEDVGKRAKPGDEVYYAKYERPSHDAPIVICLDTNVYRKLGFSTSLLNKLQSLLDTLPNATLLLPGVVLDECMRLYRAEAAGVKRTKNSFVPDELTDAYGQELETAAQKIKAMFDAHWKTWRQRLIGLGDERPTTDELTGKAFRRLMARRPMAVLRPQVSMAILARARHY